MLFGVGRFGLGGPGGCNTARQAAAARACSARVVGPQGQGEGSAFLAFRLPSGLPTTTISVPAFMTHQCGKAARDATFRSSMQLGSRFGAVHRWVDQYYLLVILLLPRFLVLHGLMDSWLSRERGRIFRHLFLAFAFASTVSATAPSLVLVGLSLLSL